MFFLKRTTISLAAGALLLGTACSEAPNESAALNLVETAEAAGSFSTLLTALEVAGLEQTIATGGPFTIFAPTDAAFAALPAGTLDALLADPAALADVLLYHVVSGTVRSGDLTGVVSAETLNGASVLFDLSMGVKVNSSTVTQADIEASNGVIHVIDEVLLPPTGTIVDAALADPNLSTLVAALQAADLVSTLQGDGPFTVFAPTNAAFEALPAGTLDALLNDVPALTNILLYHVAEGQVFSGNLDGSAIGTLSGSSISVDLSDGVRLNDSQVTLADLLTTNGVIHVIDAVLLPPMQ